MSSPELSIIVPLLNERSTLPALLEMLSRQRQCDFELLLVDGGSSDGCIEVARQMAGSLGYPLHILSQSGGKARQLNAGATASQGQLLLFLHADSNFPEPLCLRRAVDAYLSELTAGPPEPVVGHFQLRFRLSSDNYGFGYYFWECKALLDRPECTHGDQGLLIDREGFERSGPFDARALIAHETFWVECLRRCGRVVLLPARIETSARRFEVEGLSARQTLNALLMNFAAFGWEEFFLKAGGVYRQQADAGRLELRPFLDLIQTLMDEMPLRKRLKLWRATGHYVRSHAWQIPFALDTRAAYRRGLPPGEGPNFWLEIHDRWFDRLTSNPFGVAGAAMLTWCWFKLLRLYHRRRNSSGPVQA